MNVNQMGQRDTICGRVVNVKELLEGKVHLM